MNDNDACEARSSVVTHIDSHDLTEITNAHESDLMFSSLAQDKQPIAASCDELDVDQLIMGTNQFR